MQSISQTGTRELAHRRGDAIDVTLFWNENTGDVFVVVEDERDGKAFKLDVRAADALDAFQHPFAYARYDEPELLAA